MRSLVPTSPFRARAAGVVLMIGLVAALGACGDDDPPAPSTTTSSPASTATTPEATPEATSTGEPPTDTPSSALGPPTGGTRPPASAAEIAACKKAVKQQLVDAQGQQDPGGMPVECKALSEEQMTKVIGDLLSGKG